MGYELWVLGDGLWMMGYERVVREEGGSYEI